MNAMNGMNGMNALTLRLGVLLPAGRATPTAAAAEAAGLGVGDSVARLGGWWCQCMHARCDWVWTGRDVWMEWKQDRDMTGEFGYCGLGEKGLTDWKCVDGRSQSDKEESDLHGCQSVDELDIREGGGDDRNNREGRL